MRGKLFGVGVGPGDPELLSLKAVRVIKESDVIAVPGKAGEGYAYDIACQAIPEISSKPVVSLDWIMTREQEELERFYRSAADNVENYLEQGLSVAFLTIGDVAVYSTFNYVMKVVREDGFDVEMVPGITSFSAAAARLETSLTEHSEMLHVVPASYGDWENMPGTIVLMKTGKDLERIKKFAEDHGKTAMMIEKCGMPDEKVYKSLEEMPNEAGYLTTVILFDR